MKILKACAVVVGWLAALVIAFGCAAVQPFTNAAAEKVLPGRGKALLDEGRYAEGKSMGMIDPRGKTQRNYYVNKAGIRHTDGVYERTVLDRMLAPADSDADVDTSPVDPTPKDDASTVPADPPPSGAGGEDATPEDLAAELGSLPR